MKQIGETNFFVIAGIIIVVLLIIIGVASFFIIADLNRPLESLMNPIATSTEPGEVQPAVPAVDPSADANNNGIPDEVERIMNNNTSTAQNTVPAKPNAASADANNNGIPDQVEKILNQKTTSTTPAKPKPTAPPANSGDANNNGIPDEVEKIMGTK